MKILVDIRHLSKTHQTGVGKYTTALLAELLKLENSDQYTLLSTGTKKNQLSNKITTQSKYHHVHAQVANKLLTVSMLLSNRPSLPDLAKTKPDLLFLPNLCIGPVSKNLPYVLTVHDLSWKLMPEYYSKKMRLWHWAARATKLIENAREIIVPSESTKRDLCYLFGRSENRVHVIHNGYSQEFGPKTEPEDHGVRSRLKLPKRYVLFVGTVEPRKNLTSIISAVKQYRSDTGDDLYLVVAGTTGWKSNLIEKQLKKLNWIQRLGYIKSTDLPAVYRSALALIWPSIYEGFGLPVLEAMACGTPVITSNNSSLPEVAGNAALLINSYDPEEITSALKELVTSKSLYNRLKIAGIDRSQSFDWSKNAIQTREIFKQALID